jgi:hypothetical protein
MNNTINDISPYECLCVCQTPDIITIFSVLGVVIPLIISEILPLSNCDADGIIDGIIKLIKKSNNKVIQGNVRRGG